MKTKVINPVQPVPVSSPAPSPVPQSADMSELVMVGLPMVTLRKLSEEAAARKMSVAQLLASSVDAYVGKSKTEGVASAPRLLVEG